MKASRPGSALDLHRRHPLRRECWRVRPASLQASWRS